MAIAFLGTMATALLLARHVARPSKFETAEGFLRDVRDGQFSRAFSRLCPNEQRVEGESSFVNALTLAREHGQGLADYEYSIPFDRESLSAHVALGTVTHTDGSTGDLTIDLASREAGGTCVNSWQL